MLRGGDSGGVCTGGGEIRAGAGGGRGSHGWAWQLLLATSYDAILLKKRGFKCVSMRVQMQCRARGCQMPSRYCSATSWYAM